MPIGPRKNFIGSARYGVAINLKTPEFSDAMSGEVHFYDGKHVVDTRRFLTFDQLASSIISYWESSLHTELNTRRFANWLTEYFEDLGVKNANFYKILDSIRTLGKGVSLRSTGVPIKEVKVIPDEYSPVVEERPRPSEPEKPKRKVELKPVGTFIDPRQLEEPPIPKEEAAPKEKIIESKRVLPIPSRKIEKPPDDTLVKPSQLFGKKETVSPTVRVLPRAKTEKREQPLPPEDTLLKPSEVLKKRETIFSTQQSDLSLREEPYVLPAPKKKEEDKLLRPSEVLKKRETLPTIKKDIEHPQKIETKVVSQPMRVQRLPAPEDRLVRPSELFKKPEKKEEKVEHLVKPSEILKRKSRKEVEEISVSQNNLDEFQISKTAPSTAIPKVQKLPKKSEITKKAIETETSEKAPPAPAVKPLPTRPRRKLDEERIKAMPIPQKVSKPEASKDKPSTEVRAEELPSKKETEIKAKKLSIEDIKGVGAHTASILKAGGFDTVEKIANSTVEELSKLKGIGTSTAKKIIKNAKELL